MWPKAIVFVLLAASLTGCGSTTFSNQDLRVRTSGDTVYLLARSDGVSRGICANLGGDVARAEARWASNEGRTMQLGRVTGCHSVRHIIVCTDDNAACLAHEERHRSEGAFHQ